MTFQALLLHKNYGGAMSEIPQSNTGCSEENMQWRRHLSATVRRELVATETCSPDLNRTRGLADVSITALHCLRKDTEPLLDCPGSRVSLYFNDISTWQCSTSAEMSAGASYMEGSASSIWSKPSFMIQVKMEVVQKTTGTLQQVPIKAGKTQVTLLPGSLLEAFGETLIIGFNTQTLM